MRNLAVVSLSSCPGSTENRPCRCCCRYRYHCLRTLHCRRLALVAAARSFQVRPLLSAMRETGVGVSSAVELTGEIG